MEITHDYIRRSPKGGTCQIRVFESGEQGDSPVVICTALDEERVEGMGATVSELIADVTSAHNFVAPALWIEHYPKESRLNPASDTFKIVHPGAFTIEETDTGSRLAPIGAPEREPLSAEDVESLLGRRI